MSPCMFINKKNKINKSLKYNSISPISVNCSSININNIIYRLFFIYKYGIAYLHFKTMKKGLMRLLYVFTY